MKKLLGLALIAISLVTVSSCKKGENDPFLPFSSRKARLTGEWKISSIKSTFTSNGQTNVDSFNGSMWTDSDGDTYPATYEMTFEKDGTMKLVSIEDGDTYTSDGRWSFLGKNKNEDLKKKEAILLDTGNESSTGYSYTTSAFNSSNLMVWTIDKLSKKEIVFIDKSASTLGNNSFSSETVITLTAK